MLIPLGFGNWPKKFPFLTILLCVISIIWSFKYFPVLDDLKKSRAYKEVADPAALVQSRAPFFQKLCTESGIEFIKCQKIDLLNLVLRKKPSEDYLALSTDEKLKISDIAFQIISDHKEWPEYLKKDPLYQNFIKSEKQKEKAVQVEINKRGLYSKKSGSIENLIRGGFIHGSLMHLFGNLLFILLIGVWVEQRAGVLASLLSFMVGSFVGFILQVNFNDASYLLGASAGAAALIGTFYALYYDSRMRFLFSIFPFYFKTLSIRALWTFPVLYFANDIISAAVGSNTNVAHLAHVGGLVIGLVVGFSIRKIENLGPNELFNVEAPLIAELKASQNQNEIVAVFKNILQWNRQNWNAYFIFLDKLKKGLIRTLTAEDQNWILNQFRFAVCEFTSHQSPNDSLHFFASMPNYLNASLLHTETSTNKLLKLADALANSGHYEHASDYYNYAKSRKLSAKQFKAVEDSLQLITDYKNKGA